MPNMINALAKVSPSCLCVLLLALLTLSIRPVYALSPEQVLGEYWKDPLFGAAASNKDVSLEVLYKTIWPSESRVHVGETVRFIAINKGDELHLLLFSKARSRLQEDTQFQEFVADEVHHAQAAPSASHHHSHHGSATVDETVDIVKQISQRPTLLIKPGERKETLVRFDHPGKYYVFCVLDDHLDQGYISEIIVE